MPVIFSPLAEKKLKKFPKFDQLVILRKLRKLELELTSEGAKKMSGYSNLLRVRVGNYRIVYEKQKGRVYVPVIGNRGEVYQLLKRLF